MFRRLLNQRLSNTESFPNSFTSYMYRTKLKCITQTFMLYQYSEERIKRLSKSTYERMRIIVNYNIRFVPECRIHIRIETKYSQEYRNKMNIVVHNISHAVISM